MSWILVPIDFSSCASMVVEEAIAFARRLTREELLAFYSFPAEHWKHLRTTNPIESTFSTARHLAGFQALVERAGVPVRTAVQTGKIAEVILAAAAADPPRLILMGTHGRAGVAHAVLGSVAETVLRGATVPVVTVRTRHRPSCGASSCAVCEEGRSPGERALMAEADG